MKKMSFTYALLLAVISGLLTSFVFSTRFGEWMLPNLGFLAWFSLVPLFVAIRGRSIRETFILTFLTGFIYHGLATYWLYNAMTIFGKLAPAGAIATLVVMMVILSTYVAFAPTWARWVQTRWGGSPLILIPVAWVMMDLILNYFPAGGFPWNSLAYSQAFYPVMIQSSDIFGIFGITFLLILVNQLIAEIIVSWHESRRRYLVSKTAIVILLLAVNVAYGWYRLETEIYRVPGAHIARIAMVQGNIPQEKKWDERYIEENLGVYQEYMRWIKDSDVDLVVWPESSYPYLVPLSVKRINPEKLALNSERPDSAWLLFGALSIDQNARKYGQLYNSAILVDNQGSILSRYHKMHLVPFGEYIPYKEVFFFVNKLAAPVGDFKTGEGYEPIMIRDFSAGPLICYEDVFPEIARHLTNNGANVLINITNDAWYGWTSAAHQHLGISIFRAVENRRYLLRATNTGVTAIVDPAGKVELESQLYTKSFGVSGIPMLTGLTIYDRIGDLFAYLCIGIVALLTGIVIIRKRVNKL